MIVENFKIIIIVGSVALFVGLISTTIIIVSENKWLKSISKHKKK